MSGKSKKLAEVSIFDIVGLITSTAIEAEAAGHPVQIRQDGGVIGIVITGFVVDESGNISRLPQEVQIEE